MVKLTVEALRKRELKRKAQRRLAPLESYDPVVPDYGINAFMRYKTSGTGARICLRCGHYCFVLSRSNCPKCGLRFARWDRKFKEMVNQSTLEFAMPEVAA